MSEIPLISVVIPTCNRTESLATCLRLLIPGQQSLSPDRYRVVVSDDGDNLLSKNLIQVEFPWVIWVVGPKRGPAANRNHGASVISTKWLVFTDDDCLPESDWLSAYANAISSTDALAMEGAIFPIGNLEMDSAECPSNLEGGSFWSANIAVEKGLFEKVGGFDENYPIAAHEDVDLKFRLQHYTRIHFVEAARVGHPVRQVPLLQHLRRIPARSAVWAYHLKKHKVELGYSNNFEIIAGAIIYWFGALLLHSKRLHFVNTTTCLFNLLLGIPLLCLHIWQIDRTVSSSKVL